MSLLVRYNFLLNKVCHVPLAFDTVQILLITLL